MKTLTLTEVVSAPMTANVRCKASNLSETFVFKAIPLALTTKMSCELSGVVWEVSKATEAATQAKIRPWLLNVEKREAEGFDRWGGRK